MCQCAPLLLGIVSPDTDKRSQFADKCQTGGLLEAIIITVRLCATSPEDIILIVSNSGVMNTDNKSHSYYQLQVTT